MLKQRILNLVSPALHSVPVDLKGSSLANRKLVEAISYRHVKHLYPGEKSCYVKIRAKDINNAQEIEHIIKKAQSIKLLSLRVVPHTETDPVVADCFHQYSVVLEICPYDVLKDLNCYKENFRFFREDLSIRNKKRDEHIVIDFSSPNIAKPFHYGHLKSTILGNFLSNINQFFLNKTTKINYLGDWGTQFGLLGAELLENKKDLSNESTSKTLLKSYVQASRRVKDDLNFFSKTREYSKKLDERSDQQIVNQWKTIRNLSLKELMESYNQLGINFDHFECESEYSDAAKHLVDHFHKKNIVQVEQNGCLCVDIKKNNQIFRVPLLKNDGSSLYLSRDVCAAIERHKKYDFDKLLYVVGKDQEKHFCFLADVLRQFGYDCHHKIIHVKTGKVRDQSTRSGKAILLTDILQMATDHYLESTRSTLTSKVKDTDQVSAVGHELALSALFVYDLSKRRTYDYDFSWKDVMKSSPSSGIHLQTTYARLCSLIENAKKIGINSNDYTEDSSPAVACLEAADLLSHLVELDCVLESSFENHEASYLVIYCILLCRKINRAKNSKHLLVTSNFEKPGYGAIRLDMFEKAAETLGLIIKLIGLKPLAKV